jgi:hypothetical protein
MDENRSMSRVGDAGFAGRESGHSPRLLRSAASALAVVGLGALAGYALLGLGVALASQCGGIGIVAVSGHFYQGRDFVLRIEPPDGSFVVQYHDFR